MYGWSLEHIFEYVTVNDIKELQKYAPERKRRHYNDIYRNLVNIIHIASFHPDKGRNTQVEKLFSNYQDNDTGFVNKKLDVRGLNALKQTVAANRARAIHNR